MVQGTSANLGMYGMGIPVGMLVDHKGPRPAVLLGAIALALGYIPIYRGGDCRRHPFPDMADMMKLSKLVPVRLGLCRYVSSHCSLESVRAFLLIRLLM